MKAFYIMEGHLKSNKWRYSVLEFKVVGNCFCNTAKLLVYYSDQHFTGCQAVGLLVQDIILCQNCHGSRLFQGVRWDVLWFGSYVGSCLQLNIANISIISEEFYYYLYFPLYCVFHWVSSLWPEISEKYFIFLSLYCVWESINYR